MAGFSPLALFAYFLVLLGLASLKPRIIPGRPGRVVYLFRALFPSWKFFADCGHVPTLFYRAGAHREALGDWALCIEDLNKRRWRALLLNPEGNYHLACDSLLQQLLSEIEEIPASQPGQIEDCVSYELTRNLVRERVRGGTRGGCYQFKVAALVPGLAPAAADDLLISPVYEA